MSWRHLHPRDAVNETPSSHSWACRCLIAGIFCGDDLPPPLDPAVRDPSGLLAVRRFVDRQAGTVIDSEPPAHPAGSCSAARRIQWTEGQNIGGMRARLSTRTCIVAITAYPLLLILLNDSWVFGDPFVPTIDNHIYTGYFFNLRQYLNIFPAAYFGTRLPWILAGAAVHALAPPEPATYIVRLLLWYAAAFSLFSIIRLLFADDLAALIGTLLMVTHTDFLAAIGWDHVDGPGIVLILVGTALLTAAARSRHWRAALVFAGAAQAAMVTNHLILALLVPVQLAWYLAIDRRLSRHAIPASLAYLSLGALGMIGALGGVSWALSGSFFYLSPQLTAGVGIVQNRATWAPHDSSWVRRATWLVFPGVAAAAGVIIGAEIMVARIRRERLSQRDVLAALSILQLLVVGGLFAVLEVAGFWLLYYPFYACYLLPFAFIAIAALLARAMASVSPPGSWAMLAVASACTLAPFAPGVARALPACAPGCDLVGAVGALAIVATIALVSAGVTGSGPIIASAVAALAILNISVADTHVFSFPPDPKRRAAALAVYDAIRAIQPYDRDGALRFWYNWRDPLGGIFTAISSTYLWHWTLVSNEFPELIDPVGGAKVVIDPDERIVILSARDGWRVLRVLAERTVAPLGLRLIPLGHAKIRRGGIAVDLAFVEMQPVGEAPPVRISPSEMAAVGAARVIARPPGVTVETNPEPWSWAGRLPIPVERLRRYADSHAVVRVHMRVSRGHIGIGVLNRQGTAFITQQMVAAGTTAVDVSLGIPHLDEASALIVRNWGPRGRSLVDVESISIAAYAVPGSM